MNSLLTQTLCKIFEEAQDNDTRGTLFNKLHAHGLLNPFQQGLSLWSEGAALIHEAARHASPFPLAEQIATSYLAWLGAFTAAEAHATLAPPHLSDLSLSERGLTGQAQQIPHAAVANHVWCEAASHPNSRWLVLVEVRGVEATAGQNLAGEPRDALTFRGAPVLERLPLAPSPLGPVALLGALVRATQIAALAQEVLTMSLSHATTRKQFGSAVASFQAVQHGLSLLGCEVAALNAILACCQRALDGLALDQLHHTSELIATAKVQAGRTAQSASQVGHAVHAAIGFSQEHRLHRYTHRLLSYRAEFGADRLFAAFLGERTLRRGPDQLWRHVVENSAPPLVTPPGDAT